LTAAVITAPQKKSDEVEAIPAGTMIQVDLQHFGVRHHPEVA